MKKDSGKCRSAFPAWYYDASSDGCKRFVYGGHGGNGNNFKSQNLCENACVRSEYIQLTRVINWKSKWELQLVTFGNHFRSQSIRCDYVMDLIAGRSAGFNKRTIEINI